MDIVKACTVLHNFVRVRDGYRHEDTLAYQGLHDNEINGAEICSGKSANFIRDYFADYFTNTNILAWQNNCI